MNRSPYNPLPAGFQQVLSGFLSPIAPNQGRPFGDRSGKPVR
ncbi:hypothetical protein [Leptolyngbya ohadii]|nr:hypothetical protein [Leptolyngbya ohadii]